MLLVQQRDREIAGLSCRWHRTVCHKLHCELQFRELCVIGRRGWIQVFEQESQLVADKGIRILTLAVKKESSVSEVVHSVITENKKVTGFGVR